MKKFEIFIGLKDQHTYEELITADEFASILATKCSRKKIGFSLVKQLGGYSHNLGYVTETSLCITLFGIDKDEVEKLGVELKKIVNTDTIMITSEECEYYYI